MMEQLLTYLFKSAALLSIFFLVYQLLLRRDTSFLANRRFLIFGILTSLLLPAAEITRVVIVEPASIPTELISAGELPNISTPAPTFIDWWQIAGVIYLLGLAFLLARFLLQLYSLLNLFREGSRSHETGFTFVSSEKVVAPFSFFKYILYNPSLHSDEELKIIFEHEKVHASQNHSADVLFVNLAAAILWFNPLSWWYRKDLIQNLEYLADKQTVAASVSKKEYQQTLVKISVADFQPALANNFYQSLIKKRIIMLNKKPTRNLALLKTGAVLPLLFAFMFFFNVKTEAQVRQKTQESNITTIKTISTIITKSTKEETLEEVKNMFDKEGVDLKFDIVEYSEDDLLTKIAISFKKKESGQSGNVNFYNSEGIGDIRITLDDKFFTIEPVSVQKNTTDILKKIGERPLYILDGKTFSTKELAGKTVWIKGNISALSGEEAAGNFSGNTEDGVVIINGVEVIDDLKAALKEVDLKKENVVNHYISVLDGEKPRMISLESTNSEYIIPFATEIIADQKENVKVSSRIFITDSIEPLFVVDGKIKTDFKKEKLNPDEIDQIVVLKGKEAVKEYGEKGQNGVVIITRKSSSQKEKENEKDTASFEYVTEKVIISEDSDKETRTIQLEGVSQLNFDRDSKVLFVVDGIIMKKNFEPQEIAPETIENITILKGEKAIEKYGKKAAEGVIEINLKK